MKQFRVTQFRLVQLPRILEIEEACFPEDPYTEDLFREYYAQCADLFLVAWRARQVAGYSITCAASGHAELVSIAVAPEHRRKGVAQALLDQTTRSLIASHVRQFDLMVRTTGNAAIAFYRRNGFKKVRTVRNYYNDGISAISMRRTLSPARSGDHLF